MGFACPYRNLSLKSEHVLIFHQFREDGTRRRPPPSAMHGWLAKMRGTLIGDEELRSKVRLSSSTLYSCGNLDIQGMREMREAKARKRHFAKLKRQNTSGKTLFSFLGFAKSNKSQPPTVISKRRKPTSHRSRDSQQSSPRVRSPVRSPPGRPSPRHRTTGSSYKSNRMPGHYDLSRPRQNNRRSTT
jgi:hypothetical protein